VGCGTGLSGKAFLDALPNNVKCELTGTDLTQKMLDLCKEKNIYDFLIQKDTNTDSIEGQYDLIISNGAFVEGHINPEVITKLAGNNLKNGGNLCISSRETYWENSDKKDQILQD